MSHINLREEKERDFVHAYEEELKELGEEAPFVPRDEVIFRALHSGRGRFYISFEEAARQVKRIFNHRPLKCRNERKVAMYQELARLVAEYRMRKPGASFRDALFTVLPRPRLRGSFFGIQTVVSSYTVINDVPYDVSFVSPSPWGCFCSFPVRHANS